MKVTLKRLKEFMSENDVNKYIIESLLQGKEFYGIIREGEDNYTQVLSDTEDLIDTAAHLEGLYEDVSAKILKELTLMEIAKNNKA